jgi:hypothetical protein
MMVADDINEQRPKRLRQIDPVEAGTAIFSGDVETVALYIRQMLHRGLQSDDFHTMTALADALDPKIKTETKFVFKRSRAGRPTQDNRFWQQHFGPRREVVAEVQAEETRLLAKNKTRGGIRTRAVEIVAKRRGVSERKVWTDLQAAGVPRKRRGPTPRVTAV